MSKLSSKKLAVFGMVISALALFTLILTMFPQNRPPTEIQTVAYWTIMVFFAGFTFAFGWIHGADQDQKRGRRLAG